MDSVLKFTQDWVPGEGVPRSVAKLSGCVPYMGTQGLRASAEGEAMKAQGISRRHMLQRTAGLALLAAMERLLPGYVAAAADTAAKQPVALSGNVIDLTIGETPFRIGNRTGTANTINGTLPGPLIRLREGQDVTLRVTNRLKVTSSIHWHGILLPPDMDGVPGISFAGIAPGETFVYKFRVKQYGTYWYHSHSPGQEQRGMYAPLIIDPKNPDPVAYDREHVIVLSDWSFMSEHQMIAKLKKESGYFNFQRRTAQEFAEDVAICGLKPTIANYAMWAKMRMDPTDFLDVTGSIYTYLMNGLPSEGNWTGLFRPGERVRLRFINVGAMTFHDVRVPDLKMTVVQADGQNVQPVEVDEFRIGPAETYDVIVTPREDRAYTIFSEVLDRSGYVRGTLAPRLGMTAPVPVRRPRGLRTMEDMGMSMEGHSMSGMKVEMERNKRAGSKPMQHGAMDGMKMDGKDKSSSRAHTSGMDMKDKGHEMHMAGKTNQHASHDMHGMTGMDHSTNESAGKPVKHGPGSHGTGNQAIPEQTRGRLDDPGTGLGGDGRRVLVYSDLKALEKFYDTRQPERELELHATGHMERFIWSFDGKKFTQAREPIHFRFGERLRWTFVNDTMMEHTFHLHGMWMHLENGAGEFLPRKHTVIVKPAERVSVAITADERGPWAFHCHLIMHMEAGMFRVVRVSDKLPGEGA
jgi:CopA family copper-resistance protein